MPKLALDRQLSPSFTAKDATGFLQRMAVATSIAKLETDMRVRVDVPYGPAPRQKLDMYRPISTQRGPSPVVVFLHGGFWQEGDKSISGFAAQTFATFGCATVGVGYTLTPQVSVSAIVQEIDEALAYITSHASRWEIDPECIVLVGHSAGAHLAACVVCDLLGTGRYRNLVGAVLISGVFELAPIAKSYVNDLSRITEEEVARLSPMRYVPMVDMPIHVLVGGDEPDVFKIQSDALCDAWRHSLTHLTRVTANGRDHFDVLEELQDPKSATLQAIRRML